MKLLAKNRRDEVLRLLAENRSLGTQALADLLGISPITVRRDLQSLEEEGLIERVHGGAVLRQSAEPVAIDEPPFQDKVGRMAAEKQAMARYAARQIPDRCTLILDSGTSVLALAKELAGRDLTIIALDTKVAEVAAQGMTQVHLVGGRVRNGLFSLVGPWAEATLSHIHADLFFMGADAMTPEGVTNSMLEEAQIKRLVMARAKRTILLADHSKMDTRSFVEVCPLTRIDTWITDAGATDRLASYQEHIKVEVAPV